VIQNEQRTAGVEDGSALRGKDRGSWVARLREGRLRRVFAYGVADTGIPGSARPRAGTESA
jgi:hypothetical protein